MSYRHGVFYSEVPTTIVPSLTVSTPTVVVGTAPIHMAANPAPVGEPVLCSNFNDYVEQFGYSGDFDKFTVDEAAYVHFELYNIKPLIVINVLDPAKHAKTATKTVNITGSEAKVEVNAVLSSLTVKSGETNLTKTTDYAAAYEDGLLVITVKNRSKVTGNSLTLSYSEVDASKVTTAEVIAAFDQLSRVYPKYAILPGCLIAPKYSKDSEVAAVMKSKVTNINGCFQTICAVDLPDSVTRYSAANETKNANNLVDKNMIVCWPYVTLGNKKMHMSSHVAAIMGRVDSDEGGNVPYISPSNHSLQGDGLCLADGSSVLLGKDEADYLNSVGIVCGLNLNGFRLYGNYMSSYPSTTDPKDVFISVRRMINYLGSTVILTFFSFVDKPQNRILIETVETSVQQLLNGLTAQGCLLGGTIQFSEDDNALTDLLAGKLHFHIKAGFAVPAQEIDFAIEFDPSYYETLFD